MICKPVSERADLEPTARNPSDPEMIQKWSKNDRTNMWIVLVLLEYSFKTSNQFYFSYLLLGLLSEYKWAMDDG